MVKHGGLDPAVPNPDGHLDRVATARPVQLRFDRLPSADELRRALDATIPDSLYFDDVHGSPAYRRHLTHYFGEQIRVEIGR